MRTARWPDDRLLDRAGELGRILFSQDDDLPAEAELRQREGRTFAGVIYAHRLAITICQGSGTGRSHAPGGREQSFAHSLGGAFFDGATSGHGAEVDGQRLERKDHALTFGN
jgi:hypothetical protein